MRKCQQKLNNPVRIRVTERFEEYSIDYREYGGVCADAQRESEHSGSGEAGRPAQLAKCIANVLCSLCNSLISSLVTMQLLRLLHGSSFETRFVRDKAVTAKLILK